MKIASLTRAALLALATFPLFAATASSDSAFTTLGKTDGFVVVFCQQGAGPVGAEIKEDGLAVATISHTQYVIVAATPGRHTFAVDKTGAAQQVVDVAAGSVAYLEVTGGTSRLGRGPELKFASLVEATEVLPILYNRSQPLSGVWTGHTPTNGGLGY